MAGNNYHQPVLCGEVVEYLKVKQEGVIIDGTVGGAGHAEALLSAIPGVRLIGLDKDPAAVAAASERLRPFGDRAVVVRAGFEEAPEVLRSMDIPAIAGALLDLGLSSRQIDAPEKGFSFSRSGPLSMAFSPDSGKDAAEVVNSYSEQALADLIRRYGEERRAGPIARAIVGARKDKPLSTTQELAMACGSDVKVRARVFQAIRIEVNRELEVLSVALARIPALLCAGGRMAVISYHSLEDRLVKQAFREASEEVDRGPALLPGEKRVKKELRLVTRKPVVPGEDEQRDNTRSRSARMRVIEKI